MTKFPVFALTATFALAHPGCDSHVDSNDEPAPAVASTSAATSVTDNIVLPPGFEAIEIATLDPDSRISGMTIRGESELFLSDVGGDPTGDEAIHRVDLMTGAVTTPVRGLPISSPGRMVAGDGRPPLGEDIIVADWNTQESSECCDGRVLRFVVDSTGTAAKHEPLSMGSPGATVGDAFGLALGTGGEFGASLYVMDFQGSSAQAPFVFEIDAQGNRRRTAEDPSQWTLSSFPLHLEFARGNGFYGLYVADNNGTSGTPTIWRVLGNSNISPFAQGAPFDGLASLRFGPGGLFGTEMYVLDGSANKVRMVDPTGASVIFASGIDDADGLSDMVFAPDAGRLYLGVGNRVIAIQPISTCGS